MNSKFIRIYKKLDLEEIKSCLLICGDLSASCGNCNSLGLKTDASTCPECHAAFKYMAFRNVKDNMPKMLKISDARQDLTFIDFDDYKKMTGAVKAQEFFK